MDSANDLILASGSPRRQELLTQMHVPFTVHVPDIDESRKENELAEDYVLRLAREKADKVAQDFDSKSYRGILAADTIVVRGEKIFDKPKDFDDACRIWNELSSGTHQVMTAVCLKFDDRKLVKLSCTDVEFALISSEQMDRYWQTGEPKDKAGAYGIQGFASAWVKQINGSYSNVVGFPLREVNQLLNEINMNWL